MYGGYEVEKKRECGWLKQKQKKKDEGKECGMRKSREHIVTEKKRDAK